MTTQSSEVDRILDLAREMTGDEKRAEVWLNSQPIPGWAGKTGLDLLREGKGAEIIVYLEAVRASVYS